MNNTITTTLNDLFSVNGQDDSQEPWSAADDCDSIEIRGEDLVVLCQDGVARWSNADREWSEVGAYHLRRTAREIYESGSGHNREAVEKFLGWMQGFTSVPEDLMDEIEG